MAAIIHALLGRCLPARQPIALIAQARRGKEVAAACARLGLNVACEVAADEAAELSVQVVRLSLASRDAELRATRRALVRPQLRILPLATTPVLGSAVGLAAPAAAAAVASGEVTTSRCSLSPLASPGALAPSVAPRAL